MCIYIIACRKTLKQPEMNWLQPFTEEELVIQEEAKLNSSISGYRDL